MNQSQQASSQPKGGSLKWLLIILAVIVVLGGGYWLYAKYGKSTTTGTTTTSPTATTNTPSTTTTNTPTSTSDTNQTQIQTLLDNFGKAYVNGNVDEINKYLTKSITKPSLGDPQALWNYNNLPARGYKIVDFTKSDSGYTAHLLFFVYKGEPSPLNSEAGANWQLAEYRTYKIIKQDGKWLIDGSSIIFRQ